MARPHNSLGLVGLVLPILALTACSPSGETSYKKAAASATGAETAQDTILRGRALVVSHACGDCHGGFDNPEAPGWLDGMRDTATQQFIVGPFKTRARNLTPDPTTGTGRFSERQIFNALRYGLRPGDTPDTTITSSTPGQGNFPATPHYLAPPMPWPAWRHMSEPELWAIAAYLKRGLKPVSHKVQDSDGPPDFWAAIYKQIAGANPSAQFPTANEKAP